MKTGLIIVTISMLAACIAPPLSHSQAASVLKNEIRQLYNDTVASYDRLKDKIKNAEQTRHIARIKKQVEDYYTLALTLEKQEKYTKAAYCCEEILKITDNIEIKRYIRKKNNELKKQAMKSKKLAVARISEEKRAHKKKTGAGMEEEQIEPRMRFLEKLEGRIKKLERSKK